MRPYQRTGQRVFFCTIKPPRKGLIFKADGRDAFHCVPLNTQTVGRSRLFRPPATMTRDKLVDRDARGEYRIPLPSRFPFSSFWTNLRLLHVLGKKVFNMRIRHILAAGWTALC